MQSLLSVLEIAKEQQLDKVFLIPSFQSPHREITGPTAEQRKELVRLAIKAYEPAPLI